MILLIDNYDSFTYNLVQRLGELDPDIDLQVYRNDKITADQVEELKPTHLIISPGPCTPREAGVSNEVNGPMMSPRRCAVRGSDSAVDPEIAVDPTTARRSTQAAFPLRRGASHAATTARPAPT